MVGELVRREAEIAIAPLTINSQREQVICSSLSILPTSYCFLILGKSNSFLILGTSNSFSISSTSNSLLILRTIVNLSCSYE
jgi:hypothetical protein